MVLKVRHRTRLRREEAAAWLARLASEFGQLVPADDIPVDEAEAGDLRILFRENVAIALLSAEGIAPTVRGLLLWPATKRYVTVDMGAVPHVYNGADVMAPGIIDADPGIRAGDLVWVRDERNSRPLAVGRAVLDGMTMVREKRGKAVETIHHVGDDLWRIDEKT